MISEQDEVTINELSILKTSYLHFLYSSLHAKGCSQSKVITGSFELINGPDEITTQTLTEGSPCVKLHLIDIKRYQCYIRLYKSQLALYKSSD